MLVSLFRVTSKSMSSVETSCPLLYAASFSISLTNAQLSLPTILTNLLKTFEFIEQPFEVNKRKRLGSWFSADSGWAYLDCGINPSYSDAGLGVRFCRDLEILKTNGA